MPSLARRIMPADNRMFAHIQKQRNPNRRHGYNEVYNTGIYRCFHEDAINHSRAQVRQWLHERKFTTMALRSQRKQGETLPSPHLGGDNVR